MLGLNLNPLFNEMSVFPLYILPGLKHIPQ